MDRVYGFSHYLLVVFYDMLFRGEVRGVEHLPSKGPFIVAANHASHLDPILIGAQIPVQMVFFARNTLWKPGFFSWWLTAVGVIPVDRDGGSDVKAIKRVLRALEDGKVLILFPEGTRTSDGNLQRARPGIGLFACRTQVPVIPARIFGSYEAFGRGGKMRFGTPVSVVFGKPLGPVDYDPGAGTDRYQVASDRIMNVISQLKHPETGVI
jgi:1-acyl-sn-glycerol-3-phosphate acyltransferase